jgi:DNA-binding PadR family transcriptional regulator
MSLSFLSKRGYVTVQTEPAGRVKVVLLTTKGRAARETYRGLVWTIEQRWHARFGEEAVTRLRDSLERPIGDGTARHSPLFRGLEPYPNGWRASIPRPEGLPHYPMVLHRGGFPDGS